jgi:hypothetical protein
MKTFTIPKKRIYNTLLLKNSLAEAKFNTIGVSFLDGTIPITFVHLDDTETKNPTSFVMRWKEPPRISLKSDKSFGPDGVPEAKSDGVDLHILTIDAIDVLTNEKSRQRVKVQLVPSQLIKLVPTKIEISTGSGTSKLGPSMLSGDMQVKVIDMDHPSNSSELSIRFI